MSGNMRLAHRFWGKQGARHIFSMTVAVKESCFLKVHLPPVADRGQNISRLSYPAFIMGPYQTFNLGLQNGQVVLHHFFHIQLFSRGFLFWPPKLDPSLSKSSSHSLGLEMSKDPVYKGLTSGGVNGGPTKHRSSEGDWKTRKDEFYLGSSPPTRIPVANEGSVAWVQKCLKMWNVSSY